MADEFEGKPVYKATDARFVFAGGEAVAEFRGGDSDFYVSLSEDAALQMIYAGLLGGGQTVGAKLDGLFLSRDSDSQHLVLGLKFEGGGSLNVVLNEKQEHDILNPPAVPPRRPTNPH
ncbi:hypothetical protein [Brevundimonas diminuta]|uniref:hypothetical protein n=1 Tax=Brevundimonas diminuta TaxID=293 RepID=UPI00320A3E0E